MANPQIPADFMSTTVHLDKLDIDIIVLNDEDHPLSTLRKLYVAESEKNPRASLWRLSELRKFWSANPGDEDTMAAHLLKRAFKGQVVNVKENQNGTQLPEPTSEKAEKDETR